ncbi:TRAP transporter small permease [Acetomicrobium sp.]|uniref:TRAP transporter small permease n=1 Tax=Acetomicrobium sp. TaxID=1872099 RepID=UPI0028713223|nr:TRAP transporter small permease [Acetomicrobium sp.]MDR9769749.1 TRAP transporter small permease [Acetomicrobium sp.]HOA80152.1 TRAP transporter small permease [Defluviitaleaceae bacterium]
MAKIINKLTKYMEKIQLMLGVVFLTVFFVTILIQIFARYFGIPVIWTEEVSNYSFIWSVFMGASAMVNRKGHFKFNFLLLKLKEKQRIILNWMINVILLLFSIAVSYYGIQAVMGFWDYRWVALPALKMGYVFLCLPIMGISMTIYLLNHISQDMQNLMRGDW